MFRKIVWTVMAAIAMTLTTGCTDYQKGEDFGRRVVRECRKEGKPLPSDKQHAVVWGRESADWEAGYRKGVAEESRQP
jgi:hypothetical protein